MKTKSIITWIVVIVVIIGIYYVISKTPNTSCATAAAKDISVGGDQNVIYHIHPTLKIKINNAEVVIPNRVGFDGAIMRPLHTHDSSGIIHVESPCARDFTLGDFFDVWGKQFNSTCILESCADATHSFNMYVNGVKNTEFRDHIFIDNELIELKYEEIK
ncbi:hypothetical protein HZA98_00875 [Candidatus Woesearchaeota archaeon]|nr:hypothetical protein [Candidatus Woesearchaeota archaeon]